MHPERRASVRVKVYRPVRLYRSAASPQVVETLTKDLGAEGLRCVSPTVVPVATELQVELAYAPGQEPFVTRGKAVWFRSISESEQFDIGVSFIDPPAYNKRRLSVYLSSLLQPA